MPYSGSNPDLIDLQNQINDLRLRLNNVDGIGLTSPAQGSIQVLNAKVQGVQTTIKQSILKMEQLYNDLLNKVNSYITLWIQKYGA